MAAIDNLESELEELTTVDESILVLLKRLSDQIKEAGTNPARLKAITDRLDRRNKEIAAAVIAHTPGANPPYPEQPFD